MAYDPSQYQYYLDPTQDPLNRQMVGNTGYGSGINSGAGPGTTINPPLDPNNQNAIDPATGLPYKSQNVDTSQRPGSIGYTPPVYQAPPPPPTAQNGANFNPGAPGSATQRINSQNPTADPNKQYVQAGDTGGYLDGIGITVGQGSSLTPDQAKAYYDAGVAKYGKDAVDSFLSRNTNQYGVPDYSRIDSGLADLNGGGGGGAQGGSGGNGLASAYSGYLGQDNSGNSALNALVAELQQRDALAQQQQQQTHDMLMGRINDLSQPVSTDTPGIREILAAQRLASQRGLATNRANSAEALAAEGYGPNSDQMRVEGNRLGENAAQDQAAFAGQTLNSQLTQRQNELQQLYSLAVQSGDAQSARTLQAQLQAIGQQIQSSQFQQDLGLRQSTFLDSLGLQLALGQLNGNQNAFNAFA